MVAAVRGSRAVEIPGAAHMVIEDNPGATVAAVEAFLLAHYVAR